MSKPERVEQIVDIVEQMNDEEQEKMLLVLQGAMLMKDQKEKEKCEEV